MTVSSERLADVDSQLEALGVSEERISEVRARVADGFSPDLSSIDESLAELSADMEGLDAILAEARANVSEAEPALPAVESDSDEEIVIETSESDIEELDIEDFDMDDMEEIVIDGDSESPEVRAESSPDEPMPIDDAHPEGESESPFDEPLPEQSLQDESRAEAAEAAEAAETAETVEDEASASLSAQDLFDAAMGDDSEVPPKRDSEAPAAMDDLAHMLEEEVSSSGDQEAPEEPSHGASDIDALLDGGDEIEVMAEPSALVDLASLEVDEGDAMVEIGAALDEEAADDADASSADAEGDGDDDPDGEGDKKGFFKKLFG